MFVPVVNENPHRLTIPSITRTTDERKLVNLSANQDYQITISIHDLMLYDNCTTFDDDNYTQIFISFDFLKYPPEDLETPNSLPKGEPFTVYPFNFNKSNTRCWRILSVFIFLFHETWIDYFIRDAEQEVLLAKLIAPGSSGE